METKKNNAKHSNQVRIIGGTHRGRKLAFASAEGLRPTPDMVREKLFNWLGQDLTGKAVLDLFAGSGALGLESASRRASRVVMVDNNRDTVQSLNRNCKELGFRQAETLFADGITYLKNTMDSFDVVFLDPPFAWNRWAELFDLLELHLKNGAMVYVETGSLPQRPPYLETYREGRSGMSKFELLLYSQEFE